MTPFHLPSIRSSVASTAQPGRWAKFRRFMGYFPIVSKQGLYPRIYSTCQFSATATIKAKAFSSESLPSDLIRGWIPVRVKKTRQIENQSLGSDYQNRGG